jgi:2-polyprenyl-3-methyl-5-hydroxy-6-metoxy-1,4-benzoquinol methylase
MKQSDHREMTETLSDVQENNRQWWSSNPMTYHWKDEIAERQLSPEWFTAIDAPFIRASIPYTTDREPFDLIMPPDLAGKRVLEIGCGMGLHTSALVRRGADVTAIDLTEFAVRATRERLSLNGLRATVERCDAEQLPFGPSTFDLVWSWGVIHHSACTTRIVREIARVLEPAGEARVMVYNRDSFVARYHIFRQFLLHGGFRHTTPDEVLWKATDGYMARYYHKEQFNDLFRGFFDEVATNVLGQESDAIPLPRPYRRVVSALLPDDRKRKMAARRGFFLFTVASKPG